MTGNQSETPLFFAGRIFSLIQTENMGLNLSGA